MTTLSVETDLPVVVEDDLVPSQSADENLMVAADASKAPAVVTPTAKELDASDETTSGADADAGDTSSETSVASSGEAFDILFGKEQEEKWNKKPDPPIENVIEEQQDSKPPANPSAVTHGLPSPPLQTNRVSIAAANFSRPATPVVSPSPRRTTVTGTGLSELSKQLRVLQAKNQYMQSEMERCQRQLKIMSESKGVNVADVLKSLESACAKEAHAELQNQIVGLQAQLEALKAGKSPARGGGAVSKTAQLEYDSLKQQIAALQLQVGNHEELEAKYKEETKSLYAKVNTHQTAALTLESTVAQQTTLLQSEQARTAALEAEVKALREERDMLKEKQTQKMADFWQHTLQKSWSIDEGEDWNGEVKKYMAFSKNQRDAADAIAAPTDYPPQTNNQERPGLQRTFSDPALWSQNPDAKAPITNSYVASMLPRFSSTYKQWTLPYDVSDDSHRSKLYVKQSAKNMELEVLCRHQQQAIQDLQKDHTKDQAKWKQLEQERSVAQSRRNIFEQQVSSLELDLRLEEEQSESLRGQLKRREEEFSLKKEQLQSRLQHHKERTMDLEGQLSSLYVAYELITNDRNEEQQEQAELKMRLMDADTMVAQQISQGPTSIRDDATLALQLSQENLTAEKLDDVSESSTRSDTASIRQRTGLLTPSPKRKSKLNLFSRASSASSLRGLPSALPLAGEASRASTTDISGKPPPTPQRRLSAGNVGKKSNAPPPPGTTICKGYLLLLQPKKKKLLRDVPVTWKRRYMVLKRGEGITGAGTFCFWYGDEPQGKVRGTIPFLIRGVSTVSFTGSLASDSESKPHSFVIRINPTDPKAPEIHLAAFSAVDLEPWKRVLQQALDIDCGQWSEYDQRRSENQATVAAERNYVQ